MAQMRDSVVYLVLKPKSHGSLAVRAVSRPPRLAADEIAMAITVVVPDAMFKKPALQATVRIPPESVNRPTIDAAITDNIRMELEKQLGVEVSIAVVEPTES